MKSITTAILSSRESRLIKTVVSFTKSKQFIFRIVDAAITDASEVDIAIVSVNDEVAETQLVSALQRKPNLQVLFIGGNESQVANKTNHLLHKKLVSDLVPTLERMAASMSAALPGGPSIVTAPSGPVTPVVSKSPSVLHLATKPTRERLRALVVDDSPTVRMQLTQTIERMGMKCDSADGAAAALQMLYGNAYHVIYVDVVMPDMDGYKLTREIKRDAAHKATPVIILTSQGSPFDRARGALAGCDTFLTKPVDVKRFFEATAKVLRKKMAVDDLDEWITDPTKPTREPNAPPAMAQQPQPAPLSFSGMPRPYKANE
jgi:two-component system, cell cycle response regulator